MFLNSEKRPYSRPDVVNNESLRQKAEEENPMEGKNFKFLVAFSPVMTARHYGFRALLIDDPLRRDVSHNQ